MPPFKVITKEPKDMSEAELQDLATFPASVYPITYGRAYRLILDRLAAEKRHSTTWRHHARQWRRIARGYYADHKPNPIFGIDFCPCDVCARYRAFAESPEAAERAALALGEKEQK